MQKHHNSMKNVLSIIAGLLFSVSANADLNLELPALNLPDLGGQGRFSPSSFSEKEQGLKILRKLRADGRTIEDPELNIWIRSLGNRLTSNAPQSATPYYFVILKDTSVNAFATLGGVIVINAGLILRSNSESELAAVMAHESAHITQRHIPRMIKKAKGNKFARGAVLLAGVLAGAKDSQAGQAIITTAVATMIHKQLAFSRDAESEADRVGLRILATAGFNPKAMPSFLGKLEQYGDNQDADYKEFLRSHPLTLKRVSDTQIRAKQFGLYKGRPSSDYYYMKEKVRSLSNSNTKAPSSIPVVVKKYSTAQQFFRRKNYQRVLQIMNGRGREISEVLVVAESLNKLKRYQQAILLLNPLLDIHVGNEALSIILAQAYMSLGQTHNAWNVLNEVSISEQTSLEFFEVKQNVARATRHDAEVYRTAAERNIRIGNYKSARSLLRQGIKLPSANASVILQMQTLLQQIKNKKR